MAVVGLQKKRKGKEDDCWRWVLLERVKGQERSGVCCLAEGGAAVVDGGGRERGREAERPWRIEEEG